MGVGTIVGHGMAQRTQVGTAKHNSNLKPIKVFEPLDWQVEPFKDTSPVMLLTGSAGGGKSYLAATKVHGFCLKYPGSTALVLRKERAVLSNSTILFLKREIIGKDPRVHHRRSDFRFEYDNGSIMVFGGMKDADQRERIRSIGQKGGIDIAWMEEATQFTEEDYNELIARMRGNAAPWTQIMLSTNPDAPGHWINRRLIINEEASVFLSHANQNVHNPEAYVSNLSRLSGVQYRRLVMGEWSVGSGKVVDTWDDWYNAPTDSDRGGNVTSMAEYVPGGGPVMWAIDDGYSGEYDEKSKMFTGRSHPRVILWIQLRGNGRVCIFNESYAIKLHAGEHLQQALETSARKGWPRPSYIVRDRAAAQLGGVLEDMDFSVNYGTMLVDESLKELRAWTAPDENDFRRVLCHPRCKFLRYEMQTYSYGVESDRPIKEHDNGPDALRYAVWDLAYGDSPIIDVATLAGVVDSGWSNEV